MTSFTQEELQFFFDDFPMFENIVKLGERSVENKGNVYLNLVEKIGKENVELYLYFNKIRNSVDEELLNHDNLIKYLEFLEKYGYPNDDYYPVYKLFYNEIDPSGAPNLKLSHPEIQKIFDKIHDNRCVDDRDKVGTIIANGFLKTLKRMDKGDYFTVYYYVTSFMKYDLSLEMLKYLEELKIRITGYESKHIMEWPAYYGRLDVIKYLEEKGYNVLDNEVIGQAIRGGHVNIIEYIRSKGFNAANYHFNFFNLSNSKNAFNIVKILNEYGYKFTRELLKHFCEYKNLDVAEFILSKNPELLDKEILLDIISLDINLFEKVLNDENKKWLDEEFYNKCRIHCTDGGNMTLFKYLVNKGHVDITNCNILREIIALHKGRNGYDEMINWMLDNDAYASVNDLQFLVFPLITEKSGYYKHESYDNILLSILEYPNHDHELEKILEKAIEYGKIKIVKRLLEKGARLNLEIKEDDNIHVKILKLYCSEN